MNLGCGDGRGPRVLPLEQTVIYFRPHVSLGELMDLYGRAVVFIKVDGVTAKVKPWVARTQRKDDCPHPASRRIYGRIAHVYAGSIRRVRKLTIIRSFSNAFEM